MLDSFQFFVSCPKHLEGLLEKECMAFIHKESRVRVHQQGLAFEGTLEEAYQICLWSRIANRVLLKLSEVPATNLETFVQGIQRIDWLEHIQPTQYLYIHFNGTNAFIRHSQFGAQKTKDAIVDQIREKTGSRPGVSPKNSLHINVRLKKASADIAIDLVGGSLHQRGYRQRSGEAPLKENLAAALLMRGNWPEIAQQGGALVDPMCGSGTLLIEGALMAANCAPGLQRSDWSHHYWQQAQRPLFENLLQEAQKQRDQGLKQLPKMFGFDQDSKALNVARQNAQLAGLSNYISFTLGSFEECQIQQLDRLALSLSATAGPSEITSPPETTHPINTHIKGLLVMNPPYGERMGNAIALRPLYRKLGQHLREHFPKWSASMIVSDKELSHQTGLTASHRYKVKNGALDAFILTFNPILPTKKSSLNANKENNVITQDPTLDIQKLAIDSKKTAIDFKKAPTHSQQTVLTTDIKSKGSEMLANRLRKNLKKLKPWLKHTNTNCYRVYDADLPEYAVAIDRYGDYWHVQEYAAPKSINPNIAQRRLGDVLDTLMEEFDVSAKHISLKQRKRQSGKDQYQKQGNHQRRFTVIEGDARYLVNLFDYLDTGLFLDHRPLRQQVRKLSQNKRVLNLFAYTGSISVQAALGGASKLTQVDLSKTYTAWARDNLDLNQIPRDRYRLIHADCLQWLHKCDKQYDLIIIDPPSFSNSEKMNTTWDVQRDHEYLLNKAMNLLDKQGKLLFSTNKKGFKLEPRLLKQYVISNTTASSIPQDFARTPKIHQLWEIHHINR